MTINQTQLAALITALISVGAIIFQLPKELTIEFTGAVISLAAVLFTIWEKYKPKKPIPK